MASIILVVFIGISFYKLAKRYLKNYFAMLAFGLIGAVSYSIGLVIGGIILGLVFFVFGWGYSNHSIKLIASFLEFPFGLFAAWGTYAFFENRWKKREAKEYDSILDADFSE